MQHITDRPNKGETVGGTTEDDMGEEHTSILPDFVDGDDFTPLRLEALKMRIMHYEATDQEIADMVGCSEATVTQAVNIFKDKYSDELEDSEIPLGYARDVQKYLGENPNATMGEVSDYIGFEVPPQVYNAMHSNNKAKNDDKTMDGQTEPSSAEVVQKVLDSIDENSERIDELSNRVDELDNIEVDIQGLDSRISANDGVIDAMHDKLKEQEKKVEGNMNFVGQFKDDINELQDEIDSLGNVDATIEILSERVRQLEEKAKSENVSKRYVGDNPTISLELTDFEAMFIANRLWEAGEMHNEIGEERTESESKWWARKIHGERNTRED